MTTSTKYGQVSYATTGEIPQESASNLDADRKRWFTNWITNLRAKADRHTMQVHDSRKEEAERVLKQQVGFSVSSNGEKLVKATKCFLWTTAGPVAGKLFLSTEKVVFLGHHSVRVTSSSAADDGTDVAQVVPYKVFVPLARIKMARLSEHLSRPSEKYVQITTIDDFELWFVGVAGYHKFFKYLQRTISEHKQELIRAAP